MMRCSCMKDGSRFGDGSMTILAFVRVVQDVVERVIAAGIRYRNRFSFGLNYVGRLRGDQQTVTLGTRLMAVAAHIFRRLVPAGVERQQSSHLTMLRSAVKVADTASCCWFGVGLAA